MVRTSEILGEANFRFHATHCLGMKLDTKILVSIMVLVVVSIAVLALPAVRHICLFASDGAELSVIRRGPGLVGGLACRQSHQATHADRQKRHSDRKHPHSFLLASRHRGVGKNNPTHRGDNYSQDRDDNLSYDCNLEHE